MPRTTIEFAVNDINARAGFDQLQRELRETQRETRRTNATFRDTDGRLRDVRGRFVAAGQGADVFTRSLGGARGLLTGLGLAVAAREILEFGAASVRAAGEMEGLRRGLEAIKGTNADQRFRDFQEITKLPGFNTPAIIRYANALPAIQQLEQSLERNRATAAALTREIELLKNGFQDLVPAAATQATANHALELEKLKATAEETRRAFTASETHQELTPNFQAALAASNAYYAERIRQAETALAKEKAGTDAFNELQVQIFQLGRQQVAAQRTLETERTNISRTYTQERVRIEQNANNEIITSVREAAEAGQRLTRELEQIASPRFRREFYEQVQAFQAMGLEFERAAELARQVVGSNRQLLYSYRETRTQTERLAEAHQETFESVTTHIQSATEQMQGFLDQTQLAITSLQVFDRNRQDEVGRSTPFDESRRATPSIPRVERTTPLDTTPNEFGERLKQIAEEERAIQQSIRQQLRYYRQFSNQIARIFEGIATGRIDSFSQVAREFFSYSLRIVARAVIETQVLKALDNQLTASKIANINKIAAAQQAGGLAGNLPGLANLPGISNLGGFLSGGAGALGVAGLLFPNESSNLLSGIKNEISGFLSNVAEVPDRAFGAQQIFLKIGENEVRDISDIQSELIDEDRL